MTVDILWKVVIGVILGFVAKIVWDWLNSGRIEKAAYVTTVHCDEVREKCCLPVLKKDIGILKAECAAHEKKLDQGREDFRMLREDIGGIKEGLAGIKSVLEAFLKKKG